MSEGTTRTNSAPTAPPTDATVDDDALGAMALAADPDPAIGPDAISVWEVLGPSAVPSGLPAWYMPAPMPLTDGQVLRGWRRLAVYAVISAFVGIHAYGLCNTYGDLRLP